MKELRGKTAVVTGAASGIGRALAERFAREGMNVAIADHDADALARAEAELRAGGARVIAVRTDVSNGAEVAELAARVEREFGALHVACNNAGVGGAAGPAWTLSENDWRWVLGVNLWGVLHGLRVFVPRMLAHGGEAHVVNTASLAGLSTPPFMGPYVASKHAVVAASEVLARDLQVVGARVRVSVLCPGFVRTGIAETERHRPDRWRDAQPSVDGTSQQSMQQMVRAMVDRGIDPARVADAVVAAIHDERFYILTHPELMPIVRARGDGILDNRYPPFDPTMFNPPQ